jgi:hypothetical protein
LTLFQAIKETLSDLGYFTLLIFLFIFVMALLGRELFAFKIKLSDPTEQRRITDSVALANGEYISPRFNFD